jgi:hypothetical protein
MQYIIVIISGVARVIEVGGDMSDNLETWSEGACREGVTTSYHRGLGLKPQENF